MPNDSQSTVDHALASRRQSLRPVHSTTNRRRPDRRGAGELPPYWQRVSRWILGEGNALASREFQPTSRSPALSSSSKRVRRRTKKVGKTPDVLTAARREIYIALTSLGFLVGSFVLPWLIVPALLVCAPVVILHVIDGLKEGIQQRRFTSNTLLSFLSVGMIFAQMWYTVCTIAVILACIRYLIIKTEDRSKKKLFDHFESIPAETWLIIDGTEVQVPVGQVHVGDLIVVRAGEVIPVDGTVASGRGEVNEAALTGESLPKLKTAGSPVLATTLMVQGDITVKVDRSGQETAASQIVRSLNATADFKLTIETRGERYATAWALPMFGAGIALSPFVGVIGMLGMWNSTPGLSFRIVAPYGMLRSLAEAQAAQVLIKDGRVLEALNDVDTVVFDKTGTLTEDRPSVTAVNLAPDAQADEVFRLLAAAEDRQSHPIALALLAEARRRGVESVTPEWSEIVIGAGVQARVGERHVVVGNAAMMTHHGIVIPDWPDPLSGTPHTNIHVAIDGVYQGHLVLEARIRPEAAEVVAALQQRGYRTAVISGDTEEATAALSHTLGIQSHYGAVLPHEKAKIIKLMQSEGQRVCYVGDGINDAVALRQANVSVSLRGATSIAVDTAHIVLLNQELNGIVKTIDIVDAFDRRMRFAKYVTTAPAVISWHLVVAYGAGPLASLLINQTVMWSSIAALSRPSGMSTNSGRTFARQQAVRRLLSKQRDRPLRSLCPKTQHMRYQVDAASTPRRKS